MTRVPAVIALFSGHRRVTPGYPKADARADHPEPLDLFRLGGEGQISGASGGSEPPGLQIFVCTRWGSFSRAPVPYREPAR